MRKPDTVSKSGRPNASRELWNLFPQNFADRKIHFVALHLENRQPSGHGKRFCLPEGQDDRRSTWSSIFVSLIVRRYFNVHAMFSIIIHIFTGDISPEPDNIGKVDKKSILGITSLYPAIVPCKIREKLD